MSVAGLRDAIKTALETVSGLRAYDTVPDVIQVPCAIVAPVSGSYHATFSSSTLNHQWTVTVLVARMADIGQAQDTIDGYIAASGSGSIPAAIEATTLSTHGSSISCTGYRDYGALSFGNEVYLGVRFDVETLVD